MQNSTKSFMTQESHSFSPNIMRAYDIRGTFEKDLSTKDAYFLGKAFANFIQKKTDGNTISQVNNSPADDMKKICVGYDGRLSSPALVTSLIDGLVDSSFEVINIGLVPTPCLYYATFELQKSGCVAGIQVTGSHNPPDQNGFKMVFNGLPFFGDDIQELASMALAGDFTQGKGVVYNNPQIAVKYAEQLIRKVVGNIGKKLKVAWDPGNGATCEIVNMFTKGVSTSETNFDPISIEHYTINETVDGTFPGHHADPTVPENMVQLIDLVKQNQCDFGIAFDGDGDRLGVVDNKGRLVFGDQLLLIYAQELVKKYDKPKIIADVKTGNSIFKKLQDIGATPIMWKTGHSFIKAKMKEEKALLAGEMSGHLFFADEYYGFDDALFAACKLIGIISRSEQSLSDIIDTMPKVLSTPELRIEVPESDKFQMVERLKPILNKHKKEFNDLDGIRVNEKEGWWLLRASNTQNALIMRVEGDSNESINRIGQEIITYFKEAKISTSELMISLKKAQGEL